MVVNEVSHCRSSSEMRFIVLTRLAVLAAPRMEESAGEWSKI